MRVVLTLQIDDKAQEWSTEVADMAAGIQELCARVMAAYPVVVAGVQAEAPARGRRGGTE